MFSFSFIRKFLAVHALSGTLAIGFFQLAANREVQAQSPRVQFDMPYLLSARDVTPAAFSQLNPRERLVEVRFPISSFLAAGDENDLTQLVYRIEGPQGKFAVADFLPKTTLETRYAGNLNVESLSDHESQLHIDLAGNYQWLTGFTANANFHDKEFSQVKGELLPPLEAVAASGTTQRQRGVYFKLRGTSRTWLEGEKEFATILRVPKDWRADYVVVRCEAEGIRRAFVTTLDERVVAGRRDFIVALYAEGDEYARASAAELIRAETALRKTAGQQQREIQARSQTTLLKFGSSPSPIPNDWLAKLLVSTGPTEIPSRLPTAVHAAAVDFLAARERIPSGSNR
jgi:hypothetical protein